MIVPDKFSPDMTVDEFRAYVEDFHYDVMFKYRGEEFRFYFDRAHNIVESYTEDMVNFETWEDMLKAKYFQGKTLAEALPEFEEM